MTVSDYKKVFKQLKNKPVKLKKYVKHNAPKERSCGINQNKCVRCGRVYGHVGQFGLHVCRQCFREIATKIGFKKFS